MDAAKALKPSLCLELETIDATACGNHDMPADDCLEGAAVISGDDFSIDDLLDFSNGQLEVVEEEEKDSLSVSVSSPDAADDDSNSNSGCFSGNGEESDSLLGSELAVPVEDIAEELEWVSQFVDDSFPLHHCPPLPPPPPSYLMWKPETTTSIVVHRSMPVSLKPPCFPSPVPVKTRSKRSRSGNKQQQPVSLSQSTSETSSTSSWSSSPTRVDLFLKEEEETEKKMKKKKCVITTSRKVGLAGPVQFQRRCSHCLVQKTPQWRSGPLGPKTLCNACGVRYKSGRLFPEYRPACSPTFAVEIHSNSHRKVLEMRRKKESGLAHMVVSSF